MLNYTPETNTYSKTYIEDGQTVWLIVIQLPKGWSVFTMNENTGGGINLGSGLKLITALGIANSFLNSLPH